MINKNLVLLKNLLLSTSNRNIHKYSTEKKKRGNAVASIIGSFFMYLFLCAVFVLMCVGYGYMGIINSAPELCALTISVISFFFTLFKANGYLWGFKEYDMLLSMPFSTRTVVACKFLYMYIKSLPLYISISLSCLVGYSIFAHPSIAVYLIWLILSVFLPFIPTLLASFAGYIIVRISSHFKKTKIIQTVLSVIISLFLVSLRFIIQFIISNNKINPALQSISDATAKVSGIYFPAQWFSSSVVNLNILSALLLILLSAGVFAAVFYFMGFSYKKINSALKSQSSYKTAKKNIKLRQHSVVKTIAFKEFKRMTGSTVYLTNACIGYFLSLLISLLTLIIGPQKIISFVFQGAPINPEMIQPIIPFLAYFFIGMFATTASTPSLEGKNYWIIKSLPIDEITICKGKIFFNLCLSIPFMVLSVICFCIAGKVPLLNSVLYFIQGILLCILSTTRGYICGIKHLNLKWENEIEVIKQGKAVTWYMLPNLLASMILVALLIIAGTLMNHALISGIGILLSTGVLCLSSNRISRLIKK